MNKKTDVIPEQPQELAASKIEAIKNLIFGENIQQYNSEFEAVKSEIDRQKKTLDKYIEEVRQELMQSIDSLSTDLNIRITEVNDELVFQSEKLSEEKMDRKELGKMLINLGEKIKA